MLWIGIFVGVVAAVLVMNWLRRRHVRCFLCSRRIAGDDRTAHYPIEGRLRVVCGSCDDANLRLST